MDDSVKTLLALGVRHGLTTIGGMLVTAGYMQSGDMQAFIGGGMVIAGVAWSWWQKRGQAQVADALKKVTARSTTADAVATAKVVARGAAVKS